MLLDGLDLVFGRRDELVPPRSMIFVGDGDFKAVGSEFSGYFIDLCGLKPDHRVLDVGCGIGRMAVPLTRYLSQSGSYEGFDIVNSGIDWCRRRITPAFPNFQFRMADVYNKHYNPHGGCKPSEYRFPHENGSFNLVFATSVFTHMMPGDVENYLSEISRVLAPGGRCLITYFLLNGESLACLHAGASTLDFSVERGVCRTINSDTPEEAVAYDEEYVTGLYGKNRLSVAAPVRYGSWCGRDNFMSYQDVIIASKKA